MWKYLENKKVYRIILAIIILLAFTVRLIYIEKTPYTEKQHDIEPQGNGLSYIYTIYLKGELPDTNNGQLYHPPLHHILSACWFHLIDDFYEAPEFGDLAEGLQYLTLIYSMLILYVFYKILKELRFSKKIKLLLMLLASFHPSLIILSGSINNDELCLLMMLFAILRLMKWNKKPNIKNTIILAVATGLSVMSKMVGAVLAFPIIIVFIQKLYRELKKSENKSKVFLRYVGIFALFGIISLPIGLWYAVRNYILFGQQLLYVPIPGGEPGPDNSLWVGDKTLWQRLFPFSTELLNIYCSPYYDCNMPIYLIKSAIFGEFTWNVTNIVYYIALYSNIILIIYSVYSIIKSLFTKVKRNMVWQITLFLFWVAIFISYIKVNLDLPFGCTMDFRYIFLNLIIGILFIGFELSNLELKEKLKMKCNYSLLLALSLIFILSTNYILLA